MRVSMIFFLLFREVGRRQQQDEGSSWWSVELTSEADFLFLSSSSSVHLSCCVNSRALVTHPLDLTKVRLCTSFCWEKWGAGEAREKEGQEEQGASTFDQAPSLLCFELKLHG